MGGGKAPKEYLLKCAKEDHKPLESYSNNRNSCLCANSICEGCGARINIIQLMKRVRDDTIREFQVDANLAEFLSNELEYSPEFIYDLLKKFAKLKSNDLKDGRKVKE